MDYKLPVVRIEVPVSPFKLWLRKVKKVVSRFLKPSA